MVNRALSPIWQKAAMLGSIWGAFEIIAGSIIHNLALPLAAGTTLSFIGVVIMSLGATQWREKGLFWRTAVIAAVIKSVSPSAVILTPMIGILLEGLLMEIGVQLLGVNLLGLALGGGLAVISTLLFKLVRMVLIYGLGLVDIYQSLYQMATKQLPIPENSYWWPVWLLAAVYFALGAAAALIGARLATRIGSQRQGININKNQKTQPNTPNGSQTAEWRGFGWLALHFAFLVSFLAFQDRMHIIASLALATLYIALCLIAYPSLRHMLSKPKLWIPIVAVSVAATLLTKSATGGLALITPGLTMLSRAAIVIIAFSAIGKELGNERIRAYFTKNTFSGAYQATLIAFETLPSIITHIQESRIKSVATLGDAITKSFAANHSHALNQPKVLIITGEKGDGKTTFAQEAIAELKTQAATIAGFVANGHWDEEGNRSHFDLQLVSTDTTVPLCNRYNSGWVNCGPFYFNPEAISLGEAELKQAPSNAIIFIDEVGKAEVNGQIWHNALAHALQRKSIALVLCVRKSNINDVVSTFGIRSYTQFDARVDCPSDLVKLTTSS